MTKAPRNTLYYGDNLPILRQHIDSNFADLIYLDPPFNSNASYNVLFKAPDGHQSQAQIEAFDDTWHWGDSAELAFDDVIQSANSDAASVLISIRQFLGMNDMMAYLAMMAVRLIELHRVLKPNGSLYLHCDPTASHYLKILLDAIFGKQTFQNEIIWSYRRWPTKAQRYQRMHDVILFYSKDGDPSVFNTLYMSPTESSIKRWKGKKQLVEFGAQGERLPTQELGEASIGVPVNDVWNIPIIAPVSKERLGYPTQKPVALLERILEASSNEGDVVLDPFCGCGTTLHAATKLNRKWIGIDITHLAIGLIRRRLKEAFPQKNFDIVGVPKELGGAQALALQDKYEFQKWALSMIEAQPYKGGKKGGDGGIDGYLYFKPDGKKTEKAIVSVKGGQTLNPAMVKDLIVTVEQEGAKMGVFLTLELPTKGMIAQAASAGLYKTEYGQFPKIQIVTVEQLFQPGNPLHMPWQDTSVFKKSKREDTETQSSLDI